MIAGKEYNIDAFEISRLLDKSAINDILVLDEAGSTNTVSIDKLKSGELSPPFALIAKNSRLVTADWEEDGFQRRVQLCAFRLLFPLIHPQKA